MVKINVSQDCGNSPKNKLVQQLTIEHVVTHGRAGTLNGSIILMDGTTRAFCDVHEFSGAKGTHVKAITSD
jgi:hypothetical protein